MYKILSLLLAYPSKEWVEDLMNIESHTQLISQIEANRLSPLFAYLTNNDLINIQENYVSTFDRNQSHSLHLFEHLYGEDKDRGQAMVDLLNEYQQVGLEPRGNELPDYLPLFLEFLSEVDEEKAKEMLGDAVHVINYIRENLAKNDSIYHMVLASVVALSPVKPEPLKVVPVRDMDEAVEMFGASAEGIEPLRQTSCQLMYQQPMTFDLKGLKGLKNRETYHE